MQKWCGKDRKAYEDIWKENIGKSIQTREEISEEITICWNAVLGQNKEHSTGVLKLPERLPRHTGLPGRFPVQEMEDGSEELLSGYKWTGSEPEEIATYLQWESQPKKPLSVHRKQPPGKTVQIWETQTNGKQFQARNGSGSLRRFRALRKRDVSCSPAKNGWSDKKAAKKRDLQSSDKEPPFLDKGQRCRTRDYR